MEEIRFKSFCPACGHDSENWTYWKHIGCNNSWMYISYDGYLRCDVCNTKKLMVFWRFKCDQHEPRSVDAQLIYDLNSSYTSFYSKEYKGASQEEKKKLAKFFTKLSSAFTKQVDEYLN